MDKADTIAGDVLDARIDKRLQLLQDSLELRLTKTVDNQLKSRFETAIRLFGWTFGLVALVFTLFGNKTVIDLREAATSTALQEVRKKLAVDDPNSDFRRDVDRVITRLLINSYFLEISRDQGKVFAPDVQVSDVDVRRLLDLVTAKGSEVRDFRDAVDVLFRSGQIKDANHVERTLVSLGIANEEQFKWMGEQPEKRAILFELLSLDKLASSARAIVSDEKSDKRLVIAAMRYLAKINDKEAVRGLEMLASKTDETVSGEALRALAKLAPQSEVVHRALTLAPDVSPAQLGLAVQLAAYVAQPARQFFFGEDPQMPLRLARSAAVVGDAIQRGLVFRLYTNPMSRATRIVASSREPSAMRYWMPSQIVTGRGADIFARLLQQAPNDKDTASILRALCLDDDDQCFGVVHATLSGAAQVRLASGVLIGASDAPAGVYLRPRSPGPNADIIVSWTDPEANRKTLVLERLVNPADMRFDIRSIRSISERDPEES